MDWAIFNAIFSFNFECMLPMLFVLIQPRGCYTPMKVVVVVGDEACFYVVSHTPPQGDGVPVFPNFGGSFLFMCTPFVAELRVPAPEDLKNSRLFKAFSSNNSRLIQGLLPVDHSIAYNPTGTREKTH